MEKNELYHYGVLGMKWGVRRYQNKDGTLTNAGKKRYSPGELGRNPVQKGVSVNSDGSISISKGTSLQRLVSDGSRPLKDITYASVLEYDNAKYVKYIGGKGFFGGGRDKVLSIRANEDLKAPSIDEASKIMVDLLTNNPEFRNKFTNSLCNTVSDKELVKMNKDPTGTDAKAWYNELNVSMTFSPDFDQNAPFVQKTFSNALQKKGYNMLRDENDFQNKVAKAPVIILNPQKTLSVVSVTDITDDLRSKSKEVVNDYKKLGKDWVDEYVYS
jgi:hypothetical protein